MIMGYHMGKKAYVGIAVQASPSTPSATLDMYIPVTELPSLKGKADKKWFQEYRKSSAEYNRFAVTKISAEGNINCPAYPSGGLEHIMYGVFGSVTSTQLSGTAAYQHSYVISDGSPPIFTVAKGYDDQNVDLFGDCIIGSLEVNYTDGSEVTLSAGVTGRPEGIGTPEMSPSYGTERALTFTDVGASLGGSDNCDITNLNVKIDRGMKSLRTACPSTGLVDNVQYFTTTNVEGSFEMFFQDYTEYKYFLGSSSSESFDEDANVTNMGRVLTITATGQSMATSPVDYSNIFTLSMPQIVYDDADISAPWDDRMKIKFTFKGTYDSAESAGAEVITGTVRSLLSAVDAP